MLECDPVITSFLASLGLNDNETRIYLYLLSHGESIASIIAKRTNMKRPTAYATLESLEQKEFVISRMHNRTKHFDAVNPEELVHLCERRVNHMQELKRKADMLQQEFQRLHDEGAKLEAMRDGEEYPQLEVHGKLKYYEGIDAVRDMLEESLEEKPTDNLILCFGLNEFHANLSTEDWKEYTKKRVQNGLRVLSIQPDSKEAIAYKKRDAKELRETRLVPKDQYPGFCEFNVIGDMIAMFSARDDAPVAMKMYNKDLALVLRSLFKLAWEHAEHHNKQIEKQG